MQNNYSIAVLLSSYNGEKYIGCQIESILSQELDEGATLHLYIRDDGSSDSTIDIIKQYAATDKRITFFSEENIGYIRSFFSLIFMIKDKMSDYDYYALADQDDKWDSDKLKVGIEAIRTLMIPALYESTTRLVDEELRFQRIDQRQVKPISFYNTAIQTFGAGHTYVFNRELLKCLDFDIDLRKVFAHDAFINNVAIVRGKVIFDNTPHNDYRQHRNNTVGSAIDSSLFTWLRVRLERIKKGESKKYAEQICYYQEYLRDYLKEEYAKELDRFFSSQNGFLSRFKYITSTKFYRQTFVETVAFKILYLFGGYNLH